MKKRVLIAEDEPSILLSLEFLVGASGHAVKAARDGAAAVALATEFRPHLIVLDIMLPVLNGFEVCRRVRADRDLARTRILMLTARGRNSEIRKAIALGADTYLTKPFATRELVDTVNRLLWEPLP